MKAPQAETIALFDTFTEEYFWESVLVGERLLDEMQADWVY